MKLHLTLHVDLPTWDDPEVSLTETLRILAEEYPSVVSLLADVLDDDTPRTIHVRLQREALSIGREWAG